MTTKPKIGPLSVWIVGHPQNPLIHGETTTSNFLAVFYKRKDAVNAGATYVGTEHLLLGMLRQEEGVAKRHFIACGMSYEKAEYAMRVGRHS